MQNKPVSTKINYEELVEKQSMLQSLINHASALIYVKDLEGRLIFFNDKFLLFGGKTREEVLGKTDYDLFPTKEDADQFRSHDLQVIRSGKPLEFEETALVDGVLRTGISFKFPLFNSDGEVFALAGISTDITERKQLENALRVAKEELEVRVQDRTRQLEKSQQSLRNLAAHLESVREEERTNISREVHDQLGQSLTALKINLSHLREAMTAITDPVARTKTLEMADSMNQLIAETIKTVRQIASSLRPAILDDFGLQEALQWEAKEFQKRTGIPCTLEINSEKLPVDAESSTVIFRIFQEILTNITRHAMAKNVRVSLNRSDNFFILEVEDDGRGITAEEIEAPLSLGILGMSERALLLNGSLLIKGKAGQGTSVCLEVPVTPISKGGL